MVVEVREPLADAQDILGLIGNSDPFGLVPTTRRRQFVAETDELTVALHEAARR
jgi:hypothetical protein